MQLKENGFEGLRSCHPSCDCIALLIDTAQCTGTGTLLIPTSRKMQKFAMGHQRWFVPVLHVQLDCSSGIFLMGSVYYSFRAKHSCFDRHETHPPGTVVPDLYWSSSVFCSLLLPMPAHSQDIPLSSLLHPEEEQHAVPKASHVWMNHAAHFPCAGCCTFQICLRDGWRENVPHIQQVWGQIPDHRQVLLQRSLESRI